MTPLTLLRAIAAGGGALAPVHAALGTMLDAVEPGYAAACVPLLPPHRLRGPGVVPVIRANTPWVARLLLSKIMCVRRSSRFASICSWPRS